MHEQLATYARHFKFCLTTEDLFVIHFLLHSTPGHHCWESRCTVLIQV